MTIDTILIEVYYAFGNTRPLPSFVSFVRDFFIVKSAPRERLEKPTFYIFYREVKLLQWCLEQFAI